MLRLDPVDGKLLLHIDHDDFMGIELSHSMKPNMKLQKSVQQIKWSIGGCQLESTGRIHIETGEIKQE